jgi:hypothetical protein
MRWRCDLFVPVCPFQGALHPTNCLGSGGRRRGAPNVYKPTNEISQAIKQAIFPHQKALLTATPLQNSLLELYGLVSIIDDFTFGDLKSFRGQYARLTGDADFAELKQRLQPICKRTLRRQVFEYIKCTNQHALA